jgi:penicillin G amidase
MEIIQLYFAPPISGSSSLLKFFFKQEKPIPVGGSQVTVQAAAFTSKGMANHAVCRRHQR